MTSRMIFGIVLGFLSTSIMLSTTGYFLSANLSSGSGNFISFSRPELLMMIVGAAFGAAIGGISGAVIVGYQLRFLRAIVFGFLFNLFIGLILIVVTGEFQRDMIYILCALIIVGIINGIIISMVSVEKSIN